MSDISKITFKKTAQKGLSAIKYRQALDDFIYKYGCITGWERKEETFDRSALSYSCTRTSSQPESPEFMKSLIEEIKSSDNVTINEPGLLGEIVMTFGSGNDE